jgi:peptidoglycan/xylan/chitin deacetylase (PgdA/CDA1 family)
MDFLKENGFTSITLQEYYKWTEGKFELPEKPIVISFDDGFIGVYITAYPYMKEIGYGGVVALLSGQMNSSLRMNYTQAMDLSREGWEIASHSVSHKNFLNITIEEARYEFVLSRSEIYLNTGVMPTTFITPFNFINSSIGEECLKYYNICTGLGHSEKWDKALSPHPVTLYDLPRLVVHNATNVTKMMQVLDKYYSENQDCNIHISSEQPLNESFEPIVEHNSPSYGWPLRYTLSGIIAAVACAIIINEIWKKCKKKKENYEKKAV